MKTISIISQKGGSGKTTVCIHLAAVALENGKKVALIDLDPQASSSEWHSSREADSPLLAQTSAADLPEALEACREAGMDLVIVDTAPHSNEEAVQAAKLSNYLAIPCRPTILDLRAIAPSVDISRQAGKPAAIILTACPPPHGVGEPAVVRESKEALSAYEISIYPGQISQRVAFHHALIDGQAVTEFESKSKAAQEIRNLWKWLSKELENA